MGDTALALAMISDDSFYMELKKEYAPSMVTTFIRLNGTHHCGLWPTAQRVMRREKKQQSTRQALTARGCEKPPDFVNFCDAFNIPVLTMVNVNGYNSCKCTERRIAKAAARLAHAFANADVPKVTVIARTGIRYCRTCYEQ